MVSLIVDYVIVGWRHCGLATAWTLHQRHPAPSSVCWKKNRRWASISRVATRVSCTRHLLQAWLAESYDLPGWQEVDGTFCTEEKIRFELCGKIIVALDDIEAERLDAIYNADWPMA